MQSSVVVSAVQPTINFVILLLACIVLLIQTASTLRADCGSEGNAIEDTDHVISFYDVPPNSPAQVRLAITNHVTDIGLCDARSFCFPYRSIFEMSRPNVTFVTVTVKQVRRDSDNITGIWRIIVNETSQAAECTVNGVIYPPDVRAVNVTFDEKLKDAIGVLEVTKVFPKEAFKCVFYEKVQQLEYAEIPATYVSVTEIAYTSLLNSRKYYRYVCKLQTPLPEKEGVYQYKVTVFPQSRSINVNGTFLIRKPSQPTLQDCTSDFVDFYSANQSATALCKCVTDDLGAPPGDVQWQTPDRRVLQIPQTTRYASTLRGSDVEQNGTEQDHTCIVRHHTGDLSITFRPKLAFGPGFVTFPDYARHHDNFPFVYGRDDVYVIDMVVKDVHPEPTISCDNKPKNTEETGFQRLEGWSYKKTFTIRPEPDDNGRILTCTIGNKFASSIRPHVVSTKLFIEYSPDGPPSTQHGNSLQPSPLLLFTPLVYAAVMGLKGFSLQTGS